MRHVGVSVRVSLPLYGGCVRLGKSGSGVKRSVSTAGPLALCVSATPWRTRPTDPCETRTKTSASSSRGRVEPERQVPSPIHSPQFTLLKLSILLHRRPKKTCLIRGVHEVCVEIIIISSSSSLSISIIILMSCALQEKIGILPKFSTL